MVSYTNLEQRMAHTYLALLPSFVPAQDGPITVKAQEQFYHFIKSVYQTIFDSPQLLFTTLHEDDAYPNRFNRASYGKPKLINHMKKDIEVIDELIAQFFTLGQNGTVQGSQMVISAEAKIKKKFIALLPMIGLRLDNQVLSCDCFDSLFTAWQWMATRENTNVIDFSRCMFDAEYPYTQEIYSRLFGDEQAFDQLVRYLQTNGYKQVALERGPYTVDYVKQNAEGNFPLGDPKHGDPHHYGISAEYKPDAMVPQHLVLRILEMKNMLLKFERMPENLQDFVIQYAKKCDNCGYCTQTDKSGKRQPLAIAIAYKSCSYNICPLYPGFNFCFTYLDPTLSANLIAFLGFMNDLICGKM